MSSAGSSDRYGHNDYRYAHNASRAHSAASSVSLSHPSWRPWSGVQRPKSSRPSTAQSVQSDFTDPSFVRGAAVSKPLKMGL
eukprot:4281732-Pyramimonas_sp.AAC.1